METRTGRVQDQGRVTQEESQAHLQRISVLAVVITLLLTHCTTTPMKPTDSGSAPIPLPNPSNAPLKSDAGGIPASGSGNELPKGHILPTLVLGQITGASTEEVAMIREGFAIANRVAQSPCFKNALMQASFTETNGDSDSQIWGKLTFAPIKVNVDMFSGTWAQNHISHTIGYENEPGTIHMNRYFVDTAYMVADNALHECAHGIGYSHYAVKQTSVPYQFNALFEKCAAQMGVSEDE